MRWTSTIQPIGSAGRRLRQGNLQCSSTWFRWRSASRGYKWPNLWSSDQPRPYRRTPSPMHVRNDPNLEYYPTWHDVLSLVSMHKSKQLDWWTWVFPSGADCGINSKHLKMHFILRERIFRRFDLPVMSCYSSVSSLWFNGFAIRAHQHRCHESEWSKSLGDNVWLHITIVVLTSPNELAGWL